MGRVLLGVASGLVLGLLFFGALWWTVRGLPRSGRPAFRMGMSFLLRIALLGLGLFLVARLGRVELISAVPGLLAARVAFVERVRVGRGRAAAGEAPKEARWS